jgi:predicted RNA-binding protein YlqC (UPF0109 family)
MAYLEVLNGNKPNAVYRVTWNCGLGKKQIRMPITVTSWIDENHKELMEFLNSLQLTLIKKQEMTDEQKQKLLSFPTDIQEGIRKLQLPIGVTTVSESRLPKEESSVVKIEEEWSRPEETPDVKPAKKSASKPPVKKPPVKKPAVKKSVRQMISKPPEVKPAIIQNSQALTFTIKTANSEDLTVICQEGKVSLSLPHTVVTINTVQ